MKWLFYRSFFPIIIVSRILRTIVPSLLPCSADSVCCSLVSRNVTLQREALCRGKHPVFVKIFYYCMKFTKKEIEIQSQEFQIENCWKWLWMHEKCNQCWTCLSKVLLAKQFDHKTGGSQGYSTQGEHKEAESRGWEMIVTEIVVSTSIVGIALLVWNFVIQKWQTQSCVQSCISEKQGKYSNILQPFWKVNKRWEDNAGVCSRHIS